MLAITMRESVAKSAITEFAPVSLFFLVWARIKEFVISERVAAGLKDWPSWTDFAGDDFGDADFFMVLFFGLFDYFFGGGVNSCTIWEYAKIL